MIKKFNSFEKINESSIDIDFENKVSGTDAYSTLCSSVADAISQFYADLAIEIGYEEGENDKDRAVQNCIIGACDVNGQF